MNLNKYKRFFIQNVVELDPYWMRKLPLFISYPRTGSEWLNCVMELYFDRPRLRRKRITDMPPERTDWMWFHDHDHDLKIQATGVLYLYRNPIDTIFSQINFNLHSSYQTQIEVPPVNSALEVPEAIVKAYFEFYRKHLEKWILQPDFTKTVISYEKLVEEPINVLELITEHFGLPFDRNKAIASFKEISREKMQLLAKKTQAGEGIKPHLNGEAYRIEREKFAQKYEPVARSIFCGCGLEQFVKF